MCYALCIIRHSTSIFQLDTSDTILDTTSDLSNNKLVLIKHMDSYHSILLHVAIVGIVLDVYKCITKATATITD